MNREQEGVAPTPEEPTSGVEQTPPPAPETDENGASPAMTESSTLAMPPPAESSEGPEGEAAPDPEAATMPTEDAATAEDAPTAGKFDPPVAPPRKKRRWLGCLAVALVLLVALVALAPMLIPTGTLRSMVAEQIHKATGQECTVESLSFGWLDGAKLGGVVIGKEGDPLRVDLHRATANASWLPLLRKKIANLDVRVDGLRVRYRDAKAGLNLDWTVTEFKAAGADIEKGLEFSGTVHPGAEPTSGKIDLSGTAAVLKDMAFNPQGTAEAKVVFDSLKVVPVAKQAGQGAAVAGGVLTGEIDLAFANNRVAAKPKLVASGLKLPPGKPGEKAMGLPPVTLAEGSASYDLGTGEVPVDKLAVGFGTAVKMLLEGAVNVAQLNAPGLPTGTVNYTINADLAAGGKEWVAAGTLESLPADLSGRLVLAGGVTMPQESVDPAHPLVATLEGRSGEVVASGGSLAGEARLDIAPLRLKAELGPTLESVAAVMPLKGLTPRYAADHGQGVYVAQLDGQAQVAGPFTALVATIAPERTALTGQNLPEQTPPMQIAFQPNARIVYEVLKEVLTLDAVDVVFAGSREAAPVARVLVPSLSVSLAGAMAAATPDDKPIRIEGDLNRLVQSLPPSVRGAMDLAGALEVMAGVKMAGDSIHVVLDPRSGIRGLIYKEQGAAPETIGDIQLGGTADYDQKAGTVAVRNVQFLSGPLSAAANADYKTADGSAALVYNAQFNPERAKGLLNWLGAGSVADLVQSLKMSGQAMYRDGQVSFRQAKAEGGVTPPNMPVQAFVMTHDLDFQWSDKGYRLIVPKDGAQKALQVAIGGGKVLNVAVLPGEVTIAPDFASWKGTLQAVAVGQLDSLNAYILPLVEASAGREGAALKKALAGYDSSASFKLDAAVTAASAKVTLEQFQLTMKPKGKGDVFQAGILKPVVCSVDLAGGTAQPSGEVQLRVKSELSGTQLMAQTLASAAPAAWLGGAAAKKDLLAQIGAYAFAGVMDAQVAANMTKTGYAFTLATAVANPAVKIRESNKWANYFAEKNLQLQLAGTYTPDKGGQVRLTAGMVLLGADPKAPTAWTEFAKADKPLTVKLEPMSVAATHIGYGVSNLKALQQAAPGILPPPAELAVTGGVDGEVAVSGPLSALKVTGGKANFRNLVYKSGPAAGDPTVTLPNGAVLAFNAQFKLDHPPTRVPAKGGEYRSLAGFDVTSSTITLNTVTIAMGGQKQVLKSFKMTPKLVNGVLETGPIVVQAEPKVKGAAAPVAELTAKVDFKPVNEPVTVQIVRLHNLPVPDIVGGFLPSFGKVSKGVAHMPPPGVKTPVTVKFSGLDGDKIAKTVSVTNTDFLIQDIAATAQARGKGAEDGLIGMLGMQDIPESVADKVFGIKNGVFTLTIKKVSGKFNADGKGNFRITQELYLEGDSICDFAVKGNLTAAKKIEDSKLNFRVYPCKNLSKLVNIGELAGEALSALGNSHIGGADRETVMKAMNDELEKQAKARKIDMPIKGTLGQPQVEKGIYAFLGDIGKAAATGIIKAIAEEKVKREAGKALEKAGLPSEVANLLGGKSSSTTDNTKKSSNDKTKDAASKVLEGLFKR